MKVLELFAGTRSIGRAFEARGHEVFSVDWNEKFEGIDYCGDVMHLTAEKVLEMFGQPNVIWASPDCATYSVAAFARHRAKMADGTLYPTSKYAKQCDSTNAHLVNLIRELDPQVYFIENPRGGMRKMWFVEGLPRYTVTYCQYGDKRMKPTDIWTNHPNPQFKPPCKNGMPCHEAAPRGARGGTQELNRVDRARIPAELCEHIVAICEQVVE